MLWPFVIVTSGADHCVPDITVVKQTLPRDIARLSSACQDFGASVTGGLPLLPPAGHVVVPRALYDHLRHNWNDRVLEAAVRWDTLHPADKDGIPRYRISHTRLDSCPTLLLARHTAAARDI